MKSDELLSQLNEKAAELGQCQVSARNLEAWAYKDLITGPRRVAGSPTTDWDWPDDSLIQALGVQRLRARGFRRAASVRAQQWLEGKGVSFAVVQNDLISEYDRARRLALGKVTSTLGYRRDVESTDHNRRALLHQIGPLDPRFAAAGLDLGPTFYLAAYELSRFGALLTPLPTDTSPLVRALTQIRVGNGCHPIAGILNVDGEDGPSALSAIRNLDEVAAASLRDLTAAAISGFSVLQMITSAAVASGINPNFSNAVAVASRNLPLWPWHIFIFGMNANLRHNLISE